MDPAGHLFFVCGIVVRSELLFSRSKAEVPNQEVND